MAEKKRTYRLEGLNCAQCAAEIESDLKKIEGLQDVSLNFVVGTIDIYPRFEQELRRTVRKYESDARVKDESSPRPADRTARDQPVFQRELRVLIGSLLLAALGAAASFLDPEGLPSWTSSIFYGAAYILAGYKVLRTSVLNILHGRVFDEHFLMTIATSGALILGEFSEAAAVMIFYSLGEYLQNRAVDRSRRSISALMTLRPDSARVIRDGAVLTVDPGMVKTGELIEIRPGERVPLDGTVEAGESFLDTSALTGESVPRRAAAGDTVLSGSLNGEGLLQLRVEKEFRDSAVMRILELVEKALEKKASSEKFITTFARYYTPVVVLTAVLVALVPPLFGSYDFQTWIYRALVLLVISCPCALVVSIPLSYFAGVGAAARAGVLVKGAEYLDRLTAVRTAALDKTGTITKGVFRVQEAVPSNGNSVDALLRWAVTAEKKSNHPIAKSIRSAWGGDSGSASEHSYKELSGRGVICEYNGGLIAVGNGRLMDEIGVEVSSTDFPAYGSVVHVAAEGSYAGYLHIDDELKPGSHEAVRMLRNRGIENFVMLTGDGRNAAESTARRIGLTEVYSELSPEEKVDIVDALEADPDHRPVLFVGDGINDAPVLAGAYIGAAMGGIGSDAAIEAADIVLMKDDLRALPEAMKIAGFTRTIVYQNIVGALAVKVAASALGIAGIATMWMAVFADMGVTIAAILNALRILRFSSRRRRHG